jgi:hypothetical protein
MRLFVVFINYEQSARRNAGVSQTAAAVALQRVEDQKCRYRSGLLADWTKCSRIQETDCFRGSGGIIVVRIAPWNTPSLRPFFSQS